ncbi:A-kinase anchor protein 5 [Lissotriton helveticus]
MAACHESASTSQLLQSSHNTHANKMVQLDQQLSDAPEISIRSCSPPICLIKGDPGRFTSGKNTVLEEVVAQHDARGKLPEETCNKFTSEIAVVYPNKDPNCSYENLEDGTIGMEHIENKVQPEETLPKKSYVNEKKSKNIITRGGRYARKPLKICFKKRSKALKSGLKSENDYDASDSTFKEMSELHLENCEQSKTKTNTHNKNGKDSQRCQGSGGTWASFKSLMSHRKKWNYSSKMQSCFAPKNRKDVKVMSTCPQNLLKPCPRSKLKIPCIKLARSKKKPDECELADEAYSTAQTIVLESNLNKNKNRLSEGLDEAKSNRSQSLFTVDLEDECDLSNEELTSNTDHSSQKCLHFTMRSGSSQPPQYSLEAEILTPDAVIEEEHIHPDQEALLQVKVEQFCDSSHSVEKCQENQWSSDLEQSPAVAKNKELPHVLGRENQTWIESIDHEDPNPFTDLKNQHLKLSMVNKAEGTKQTEGSSANSVLYPERSDTNGYVCSENGVCVVSIHTDDLHISDNSTWISDTKGCNESLSNFHMSYQTSGVSDEYEELLADTASSLVKAVIQSSIEQLIDEMTFDNHAQTFIVHT